MLCGTASRIKGITFEYIAQDVLDESGYLAVKPSSQLHYPKPVSTTGEMVVIRTSMSLLIASMQDAVRNKTGI